MRLTVVWLCLVVVAVAGTLIEAGPPEQVEGRHFEGIGGEEVSQIIDREEERSKHLGVELGKCMEDLKTSKQNECAVKTATERLNDFHRLLAPQVSSYSFQSICHN